MKKRSNIYKILTIAVAAAIGLSAACGTSQIGKANALAGQANSRFEKAKKLYDQTEERNTALFSTEIETTEQLADYKEKMKGEAQSIVADYEQVIAMTNDVSKQYDEIAQLDLNEKYKNYAKLKSDEYAKRAEAVAVRKNITQSFSEIDDPRTMTAKFDDNNAESNRIFKDADDLHARAKKMEEDYQAIFKS